MIRLDGDVPPRGAVESDDDTHDFAGWVELLAALDDALRSVRDPGAR